MKKFRVVCIKIEKFALGKNTNPVVLTEQIINVTTKDAKIDLPVPIGMQVMSICELLPDITISQVMSVCELLPDITISGNEKAKN